MENPDAAADELIEEDSIPCEVITMIEKREAPASLFPADDEFKAFRIPSRH